MTTTVLAADGPALATVSVAVPVSPAAIVGFVIETLRSATGGPATIVAGAELLTRLDSADADDTVTRPPGRAPAIAVVVTRTTRAMVVESPPASGPGIEQPTSPVRLTAQPAGMPGVIETPVGGE